MLKQSNGYLRGNVPVGGYSAVVWTLVDDALVSTDVPGLLYPTELAKAVAGDASRIAPRSLAARSAVAAANLAQANLIETSIAQGEESVADMGPVAQELKIAALATGIDAIRGALDAGVQQGLAAVAIGAIGTLADAEIIDSIAESSLLGALRSSDKRVQYAAAEAIVRASRGANVPNLSVVVGVLAQAVTEEKVNTIHVIMPDLAAKAIIQTANGIRGNSYTSDATALEGQLTLLSNPSIDVVVINEILPGRMPEDVIGNIRKDNRMTNTKIVIVTKDAEAAAERFGDGVTFITAPISPENLNAVVAAVLEGAESPGGTRAEGYASKASAALLDLAGRKADIGSATANLALQLNRGDSVAVPAAKALGLSGGEGALTALVGALQNGSDDLKKASALAIGGVLSRMSSCPDDIATALMTALDGSTDGGLRAAITTAFAKSKLDAQKKLELMQKLSRIASK